MNLYRFYIGINGEKTQVYPIYKDDLSLDYELESNQRFYRKKISGKLSFVRNDFALINSAAFNTEFKFTIEHSTDFGLSYSEIFKGKFYKTDCTIDEDNEKIEVQPSVDDEYNKVLAGFEKEYNLIELAPDNEFLTIYKRPLIQVYVPGDDVVTCFFNNYTFEIDVNSPIDDVTELASKYYFALSSRDAEVTLTAGEGAPDDLNGVYVGHITVDESGVHESATFMPEDENIMYYLEYSSTAVIEWHSTYTLKSKVTGSIVYQNQKNNRITNETINLSAQGFGTTTGDIKVYSIMARYLSDVDEVKGVATYDVPTDDIVADNKNYHKVLPYNVDTFYISNNYSDTPTQWGKADDGRYFLPPEGTSTDVFYPVARSTWRNASVWFKFYWLNDSMDEDARKAYTLRDAATLSSTINVLLQQFAPEITHKGTAEYSQFLYADSNPLDGGIRQFTLLISQKSNIINGEYQTPAQNAPITLQQILNMLRDTFKLYWYIEDNKLKIEHVEFFRNGGSYSKNNSISYDLTKLINVRNNKPWAFGTSNYTFDKEELPERYEFEWMDDVSTMFEGNPIEVVSPYVQEGKIEDITISNFTSDIDLLLLNPSEMSSDGFALFAAVEPDGGGQLELPFVDLTVQGVDYHLQNGYLSYFYMQPKFWLYDMPAKDIRINGGNYYARSIDRRKKQTLSFPASVGINPIALIKTYLGSGQIEKISVNLCSYVANTTLKYDTE